MKLTRHRIPSGTFLVKLALVLVLATSYGCSTLDKRDENAQMAEELHQKGLELYFENKYTDAIDTWLKEIEIAPGNVRAYNNIGITYVTLRQIDRASEYVNRAIEVDPKFGHSYYTFGRVNFYRKDYAKALELFQKAIDNGYSNADVDFSIAQAYRVLGDCTSAVEAYDKTLEKYFNYPMANYGMGDCYMRLGKYDMARLALKREIDKNPDPKMKLLSRILMVRVLIKSDSSDAEAFFTLGKHFMDSSMDSCYECIDYAEAVFRKAEALDPDYPGLYYQLGRLYEQRGYFSAAERGYARELELNPGNKDAIEALEDIRNAMERQ
jgi:tetratricopeptide (TPR) repeat protein